MNEKQIEYVKHLRMKMQNLQKMVLLQSMEPVTTLTVDTKLKLNSLEWELMNILEEERQSEIEKYTLRHGEAMSAMYKGLEMAEECNRLLRGILEELKRQ
jgi:hypothetical protein